MAQQPAGFVPDGFEPDGFEAEASPQMNFATVNGQRVPVDTWSEKLGLHTPDASPALGFLKGSAGAIVDAAEGAKAGLASTVFHGGDLIRRATGMERVIDTPEAQAAMTAPDTFAGTVGKYGEQAAEFALPLSTVSKGAAALSWLPRMAVEGAASAGVTGIQTGGDAPSMAVGALLPAVGSVAIKGGKAAVNAATRAAAGAEEGGLGGAIASAFLKTAPAAPKSIMIQALRPRNTRLGFEAALDRALPELKATEGQLGKPIASVDDLLAASKLAKQRIRGQIEQMMGPVRQHGLTADTSSVATAIEDSIPRKVQMQDPAKVESIKKMADVYRGRMDIDDVDTLIRETNAELEAYYNKNPGARARATAANPDTAQLEAEVSALRKVRDQMLDAPGGGAGAKELYRRYGSLMEIEDAAWRRSNVAKRAAPESLTEQMSKIMAARDIARAGLRGVTGDFLGAGKALMDLAQARAGTQAAKFLKEQQTSDALVRSAMRIYRGAPGAITMPPPVAIRGLLPSASVRVGAPQVPDPSFVRGVPAEYGRRPLSGLLNPPAVPMGPSPDRSFVRGVRGEYPPVEK